MSNKERTRATIHELISKWNGAEVVIDEYVASHRSLTISLWNGQDVTRDSQLKIGMSDTQSMQCPMKWSNSRIEIRECGVDQYSEPLFEIVDKEAGVLIVGGILHVQLGTNCYRF